MDARCGSYINKLFIFHIIAFNYFYLLFFLQQSSQEIDLKCGEDCLLVTTKKQTKYELDIFLPYSISQENVNVTFNTITKVNNFYSLLELHFIIPSLFI